MCIISNHVETVAKTKILVAVKPLTNRQLTVYSNYVDNNSENNAMILPVPYPNTVQFHDLSNYKNIFTDCDNCFPKPKDIYKSTNLSTNSYGWNDSKPLKVFNVGSYQVSLANSLSDLKRVDTNVFKLSKGCDELLSQQYNNPIFGFIICKLSKGSEEYHPFGYSHNLPNNNQVFIPTKHYHEHNSNKRSFSEIDNSPMFQNFMQPINVPLITDDWDHEIYLYNVTSESNPDFNNMSQKSSWSGHNLIKKEKIDFDLGDLLRFEKHRIRGRQKNIDLIGVVNTTPNHNLRNNQIYAY